MRALLVCFVCSLLVALAMQQKINDKEWIEFLQKYGKSYDNETVEAARYAFSNIFSIFGNAYNNSVSFSAMKCSVVAIRKSASTTRRPTRPTLWNTNFFRTSPKMKSTSWPVWYCRPIWEDTYRSRLRFRPPISEPCLRLLVWCV